MTRSRWSPDRDAVLGEHKATGASSTAIALRMGTTRNAVIGRKRAHRPKPAAPPEPIQAPPIPTPAPRIGSAHLGTCTIIDRRMGVQCGWVLNDRSDDDYGLRMVCGRPVVEAKEYCAEHLGLMFQPRAARHGMGAER